MTAPPGRITCLPLTGIGEIRTGDDLATVLGSAGRLHDGDILVVTSKVVSKAEGRVVRGDRADLLADETERVVATRGDTSIVRTHHGLVMAAAGIDASNTEPGTVVLLPVDPDASARALRERIAAGGGPNVAVVVTDTSGRAWRNGQTDLAIGAAGLEVMHDYQGRSDDYGNLLAVTAPAVADEIAGTADLATGKLSRSPAAVVRGLSGLVLAPSEHGPGARALVREESHDMFGYGAREAVLHAVHPDPGALPGFGHPAGPEHLAAALRATCPPATVRARTDGAVEVHLAGVSGPESQRALGAAEARLTTTAHAMGWRRDHGGDPADIPPPGMDVRLRFCAPVP
ncbi:MAG TPA: coenzyme F420-0:L-glutamate ligase [Nocardioidaceae bacterium]|nr:coenzyme F420-0:L-glutamate ligase [Nocardioidaceae bacterium]